MNASSADEVNKYQDSTKTLQDGENMNDYSNNE